MKKMQIYLNFNGNTEEAFTFYKKVFNAEFRNFSRFGEMPAMEGFPPLPDSVKDMVLHVQLPIGEHAVLMGSDSPAVMGRETVAGTNFAISINTDSIEETDKLYTALSDGGKATMPLSKTFWGAYHGALTDKFGIQWMLSYEG